jgi:formate hydrogenlyase transcriptional activator
VAAASRDDRGPASGQTLAEVERAHILRVLRDTNWVIGGPQGAAARLGVKRTTLIFRMQKLGIPRRPPCQDADTCRLFSSPPHLSSVP